METQNILHHSTNTPILSLQFTDSIDEVKIKTDWFLSDDILYNRKSQLEASRKILEINNPENIKALLEKFRNKEITLAYFQQQRALQEEEIEKISHQIQHINDILRYREIEKNLSSIKRDESFIDIEENLETYIWNNIMNWWSNALWVYEIIGTNLVLIQKTFWSYKFVWDLEYYYKQIPSSKNIPSVQRVFIKKGSTYIIMEKALWKQLDEFSEEEISQIPQKHFDDFVTHLRSINKVWLCIDPSKRSNFFYDSTIWFIFIDLQIWRNEPSHLEINILSSILWNTSNPPRDILQKIKNSLV